MLRGRILSIRLHYPSRTEIVSYPGKRKLTSSSFNETQNSIKDHDRFRNKALTSSFQTARKFQRQFQVSLYHNKPVPDDSSSVFASWLRDIVYSKGFGKFDRSAAGSKTEENGSVGTDNVKSSNDEKSKQSSTDEFKSQSTGGGGGGGGKKPNKNKPEPENMPPDMQMLWAFTVVAAGVLLLTLSDQPAGRMISFQDFQSYLLESGQVDRIVVTNRKTATVFVRGHVDIPSHRLGVKTEESGWKDQNGKSIEMQDMDRGQQQQRYPSVGTPADTTKEELYYFEIGNIETFEQRLEEAQRTLNIHPRDFIPVMYATETSITSELSKLAPTLLFTIALVGAAAYFARMAGGGAGGGGGIGNIFKMSKSPAKRITKENVTTSFKDVAGCDEAKREIMEFVEFLKDSKKFTDLGAKIPRGALLTGPPGTGKTLLAKATAGEANVPFFSVSGSDFVEMFVGLGASRVRELFKEAKAEAPCIVFIDEIDAIGRKRGRGGSMGGNDERENTLNQLLVEMDGFGSNTNIVILAGTNRLDVLDPALTRPGRFDRTITVDKPDIAGRKSIFEVHLKSIVIDGDAESYSSRLAALTPGFVGADIANICNEAAIIAARHGKKKVDLKDFEAATDRVIGGLESKKLISPEEKKVIAYHEAGHAVAGWNLEHADPLLKVTIVPRGNGALGFAQYLPKEIFLRTKDQIMDIVCMALAGRASEQVNFGKVTTGASDDLRRVTQIVYQMVQIYGMNDRIGQVAFPRGDGGGFEEKMYSNATGEIMDEEVRKIVDEAYVRTLNLIREKNNQVKLIAELLIEKETITNHDVTQLIGKRPYSSGKEYESYVDGVSERNEDEKKDEEVEGIAVTL